MSKFKINKIPDKENYGFDDQMDPLMLPICKKLTEKGYVTKFSCEGHFDKIYIARNESGVLTKYEGYKTAFFIKENTIYTGLYSAYIFFEKTAEEMNLPDPPKYWKYILSPTLDPETNKIIGFHTTMRRVADGYHYCDYFSKYIRLREATKEEIIKYHRHHFIDRYDLKDHEFWEEWLEDFKKKYMETLSEWVELLPDISESEE